MKLLKSQTNELFQIIEKSGFSPNQFEIYNDEEYDERFEIEFKESDFNFYLKSDAMYRGRINAFFCPGEQTYESHYIATDWSDITIFFRKWLKNLKREINEPDLWERFRSLAIDFNYKNEEKNDQKFTAKEYQELSYKIDMLTNKISESTLDTATQKTIIDKLNDIQTLALDLNKFDWFNLFVGTIMSIFIQLNVSKDNANLVWNYVKEVFGNLSIVQ